LNKRTHTKPLSVGSHLTKKVSVLCGAKFTFHDLRRTFSTMAAKQKVPDYIIKRLINHSIKSDVTSQYLVLDVDNLRKHMNAITRTFLELLGLKGKEKSIVDASMYVPPSEVIQLKLPLNY